MPDPIQATVRINRGVATLPENVRQMLTRPRKAGEAEAAIDPLTDPPYARRSPTRRSSI